MAELTHKDLLTQFVKNSGLSLREISRRAKSKGKSVSQSYLSMLTKGETPPPSEEVSKVLAEITGGDAEKLIWYGLIEKNPLEVQPIIRWYYEQWNSFVSAIAALRNWDDEAINKMQQLSMKERVCMIMDSFQKIIMSQPKLLEANLPIKQVKVLDLLNNREYFEWVDRKGIEDGDYIYILTEDDSMKGAGIAQGSKVLCRLLDADEEVVSGSVYFLSLGAKKLLRRVYKDENGQMVLVADNPSYQPLLVNNPDELQLIGLAKSVKLMITN